jgi:FkbM family methyltransferase
MLRYVQRAVRWGLYGPLFSRAPFDAWIANTVLAPSRPKRIELENCAVTIDCTNAEVLGFARKWASSPREKDARQWLTERLRDGDTLLNVGAHIGLFALYAHAIRDNIGTICVEASSPNVSQLIGNIALNELSGIDVIHCAAGADDGLAEFLLQSPIPGNYNGHLTSLGHNRASSASEWVQVRAIDGLLGELNASPDILVMDIDGHEVGALKGMKESLSQLRAAIIETNSITAHDVFKIMERAGFACERSSPNSLDTVSNRLFVRRMP